MRHDASPLPAGLPLACLAAFARLACALGETHAVSDLPIGSEASETARTAAAPRAARDQRRVRRRAHVLRAHRVHVRVRGEVPRGGRAGRRHRRAERVFSLPRHVPRARAAHGGGARAPRGPAHARPRRARVVPVHGRLLERVRGTGARAGQRNAVRRRDLQLRHRARRRAGGLRSRLPRRGNHLAQQIRRFGIGRFSKRRGVRPHHRGVAVDHRRRRHALRRREPEGRVLRRARVCHRAGRDHPASAGTLRARRARGGVRADHDARRRARRRRGGRTARKSRKSRTSRTRVSGFGRSEIGHRDFISASRFRVKISRISPCSSKSGPSGGVLRDVVAAVDARDVARRERRGGVEISNPPERRIARPFRFVSRWSSSSPPAAGPRTCWTRSSRARGSRRRASTRAARGATRRGSSRNEEARKARTRAATTTPKTPKTSRTFRSSSRGDARERALRLESSLEARSVDHKKTPPPSNIASAGGVDRDFRLRTSVLLVFSAIYVYRFASRDRR